MIKLGQLILNTENQIFKMKFELAESQTKKLKKKKKKIKELHGKYGQYDFIFTPTGIGVSVKVVSHLSKESIDLSEYEKW